MDMKNIKEKSVTIIERINEQFYNRPRALDQEPDSLLIGIDAFNIMRAVGEASYREEHCYICGFRSYVSPAFDSVHVFKKEPAL